MFKAKSTKHSTTVRHTRLTFIQSIYNNMKASGKTRPKYNLIHTHTGEYKKSKDRKARSIWNEPACNLAIEGDIENTPVQSGRIQMTQPPPPFKQATI
ncbi:hypothetical protein RDWZM_007678 [Blomia tropicalis]|uniref:Uncharacterized protein n=1 Tax=Blomia tropicalis TaxID=40697 RepID=A0A9Q0RKN7_BLOTA|nr:hypothetical protein RDWZM_007678 [Blomia tropicalis]